jgi:transcriptional regulator with XRE-family HTH domain
MMFNERIKQMREDRQIPQRKMAAAIDIDTASYCKIEKGERKAKREHVPIIANLLQVDETELLTIWLAHQIFDVIDDDMELANKALIVVQKHIQNQYAG